MHNPGRFIVVEGLEGAGKTTSIETIKQFLESHHQQVVLTREPGGTGVGEKLRTIIKESVGDEILDARSELLLLYAARVQLVEQVIKPALAAGKWVIADRFELSTYAYQGGGRGLKQSILDSLSAICLNDFKPDLILFLDITPQQGLERVRLRGKMDRIEKESLDFFRKVYQSYHQCIQSMNNVSIIDASAPLAVVKEAILKPLLPLLSAHNAHV